MLIVQMVWMVKQSLQKNIGFKNAILDTRIYNYHGSYGI
jgi:hypothetical protein